MRYGICGKQKVEQRSLCFVYFLITLNRRFHCQSLLLLCGNKPARYRPDAVFGQRRVSELLTLRPERMSSVDQKPIDLSGMARRTIRFGDQRVVVNVKDSTTSLKDVYLPQGQGFTAA